MKELYSFLIDCSDEEKEEAINTFYITERELVFLNKKGIKIEQIKRQILLFEFSSIIDDWDIKDLIKMFELYNISDDEIKIIFSELYKPFDENIINHSHDFLQHKEIIDSLLFNSNIQIEDIQKSIMISEEERINIITKREKMKSIFEARKESYRKIGGLI